MRSSESTAQIDAVMADVQKQLEPVRKNKVVDATSKDKADGSQRGWSSKYATLAVLHEACHATLTSLGVAIYQGGGYVQGAGERLITRLSYKGEFIECDFPVKPTRDGPQGFGAGVSFARRWGLCGMVGLVAFDDIEEQQGYRDERPAKPAKQKAAGIAAQLDAIRMADSHETLAQAAMVARSAHPTGEAAVSVERAIGEWFVAALSSVKMLDDLTMLRDLGTRVRPRGNDVRDALARAEKRLMGDG